MITISKNYQSIQDPKLTIQNFKHQIDRIKKPYLQHVQNTTNQFHHKVQQFEKTIHTQSNISSSSNFNTLRISQQYTNSDKQSECFIKVSPSIKIIQQKTQNVIPSQKQIPQNRLRDWQPVITNNFNDYQQLVNAYQQIFQKKMPKRRKNSGMYDFRKEQADMLKSIYKQIQKQNQKGATFSQIQQFFTKYQLFYSYYNIHPKDIRSILKQFARTYSNMLTSNQFIKMMLNDRPILVGFEIFKNKNSEAISILNQQSWKDLKGIFDTLDTFGNEIIYLPQFIYRIKNNLSYRQLLNRDAISYPQINRKHTLRKIIFDLEYKYQFDKKIKWEEIKKFIQQFRGKQQPSIDIIYKILIQNGKISKESNYFYLEQQVLNNIKDIFKRCPKYSMNFVSKKFISEQLMQSQQLKKSLQLAVRKNAKGCFINLQEAIKYLMRTAHDFLDLDQILDYFSIRGPPIIDFQDFDRIFNQETSEEDEDIEVYIKKRKQKKIKTICTINQVKVRTSPKQAFREIVHYTTIPQQFNFYHRSNPSTRCQKVRAMLKQKQDQQTKQLQTKFKANPIPPSINQQIYRSYLRRMQKKKQYFLEQFNRSNQKAKQIVDYLKSNTKIFQNKTKLDTNFQRSIPKFQAKPIPWFVENNILGHIEAEKQLKKKQIFEQTKKKHQKYKLLNNKNKLEENFETNQSLLSMIPKQSQQKKCFKSKPIPNFKELQKKFEQELKEKKLNKKLTQPQEFHFHQIRQKKIKNNEQIIDNKVYKSLSPRSISYDKQVRPISQTKKIKAWFELNQAKLKRKIKQEQIIAKQQYQKKQKQRNFAKFMRKKLKKITKSNLTKIKSIERVQMLKQKQSDLKRIHQKQLSKIYQNVIQRPFLFQQQFQNKQNYKSKKQLHKLHIKNKNKQGQQIQMQDVENQNDYDDNEQQSEVALNKSSEF